MTNKAAELRRQYYREYYQRNKERAKARQEKCWERKALEAERAVAVESEPSKQIPSSLKLTAQEKERGDA